MTPEMEEKSLMDIRKELKDLGGIYYVILQDPNGCNHRRLKS